MAKSRAGSLRPNKARSAEPEQAGARMCRDREDRQLAVLQRGALAELAAFERVAVVADEQQRRRRSRSGALRRSRSACGDAAGARSAAHAAGTVAAHFGRPPRAHGIAVAHHQRVEADRGVVDEAVAVDRREIDRARGAGRDQPRGVGERRREYRDRGRDGCACRAARMPTAPPPRRAASAVPSVPSPPPTTISGAARMRPHRLRDAVAIDEADLRLRAPHRRTPR